MVPDIVEIKRLCTSGQWIAKVEDGMILLHDTVAGETVCIGSADEPSIVRCAECMHRGNPDICPWSHKEVYKYVDGIQQVITDGTVFNGFCHRGEKTKEGNRLVLVFAGGMAGGDKR